MGTQARKHTKHASTQSRQACYLADSGICCSLTTFNMYYATPAQLKIGTDKIIQPTLIQPDFFMLSEDDFRGLHLHNLKSLRRYHCTQHSHNLTFTTSVKFVFTILNLDNSKSLRTIWLYTTLTQPGFHDICTISFQGSTLALPEILISMVKFHISRYTRTP